MCGSACDRARGRFAALAAIVTTGLAVVVGYGLRLRPGLVMRASARIAGLGYAIPGAVIAVGVLLPFARLDNALDAWMRASFGRFVWRA